MDKEFRNLLAILGILSVAALYFAANITTATINDTIGKRTMELASTDVIPEPVYVLAEIKERP